MTDNNIDLYKIDKEIKNKFKCLALMVVKKTKFVAVNGFIETSKDLQKIDKIAKYFFGDYFIICDSSYSINLVTYSFFSGENIYKSILAYCEMIELRLNRFKYYKWSISDFDFLSFNESMPFKYCHRFWSCAEKKIIGYFYLNFFKNYYSLSCFSQRDKLDLFFLFKRSSIINTIYVTRMPCALCAPVIKEAVYLNNEKNAIKRMVSMPKLSRYNCIENIVHIS